jgi:hypothetical protein
VTCSRPVCGLGLLAISLLAGLTASGIAPAAETSVAIEVQELLQIPVDQRRRLVRGELVSYPVAENSERELAVGLAVVVSAPVSQVAQYLSSGQLISRDASIGEFGLVPDEISSGTLVGPGFTASEREEALSLFEAAPGTRFNLSLAEIDTLRTAKAAGGSRTGAAELASDTYRRILAQRMQSYRQGGLAGIAAYARTGGAVTDPAVDLQLAIADVERIGRTGSDFREALMRYPADQPAQMASQVYWVKRRVQRRPHLSLLHRMVVTGAGPMIHLERYFYVGHSFNSMEILTGALAYQDGTMVFSTTRVSTDEVLGMGGQLKRTVARGQVRDEMRTRLERLRSAIPRPGVTESP